MKHTTHDIDNEGSIGMDLTYCDGCGLEADDCKCDAALADEELADDDDDDNERLKANRRARS